MFAIMHNKTKVILSQDWLTGASHWEGEVPKYGKLNPSPRLFPSLRAARAFVSSWARGKVEKRPRPRYSNAFNEIFEDEYDIVIIPQGRRRTDLSILPVTISYGDPL